MIAARQPDNESNKEGTTPSPGTSQRSVKKLVDGNQAMVTAEEDRTSRIPKSARFVIGAVVTSVIGIAVANLYPVVKNLLIPVPTTAPMTFKVSHVVSPGYGITVPDQHRFQPLLNSINDCGSLHRAAIAAGGVEDGEAALHLLAQGNTSSGVTITGMHVRVIKRSAPLSGAYAFCQSAGSEVAMPIDFNLNDTAPEALGPAGKKSFFANGSVVHLSKGEVYPFQMAANVSDSSVKWVIEVSIIIDGKSRTVTVTDNGRPFETTAALPLSQYGDLYEYDWAIQDRLLHFRSHARNPDDCAADVAMKALRSKGLSAPGQVLSVDCAANLAHVEVWIPSDRCFAHYLGFHRQSRWSFFASRDICPGSDNLGAVFSRATIRRAGGDPRAFANAFGPYIVSSGSIPANPGPYDHVPQLSADALAARAGCATGKSYPQFSAAVGARETVKCRTRGALLLILKFPDSARRNRFFTRVENSYANSKALAPRAVGDKQLWVVGPTWLVYGNTEGSGAFIAGLTEQQFAQKVGGEEGILSEFNGADRMIGEVPTIADLLL